MNPAMPKVLVLMVLLSASLTAQSVEVSLAPQSYGKTSRVTKRGPFEWTLGAVRFVANGSPVDLEGFTLTVTASDLDGLDAANGIQAWLDDGNQKWDGEANETELAASGGAPAVSLAFAPITLAPGSPIDIWIRCSFTDTALNSAYVLQINDPGDVSVTSGSVALSAPPPRVSLTIADSETESKQADGPSCQVQSPTDFAAPGSLIACALVIVGLGTAGHRRRRNGDEAG